ncbi:DUF3037 domain-containing protein [Longispora sp. K20-0274]|uniref:DUF3037 domain-containing protein n=1 Tax=Longispora sp. K20-0274 TaxID=3088255 RepID=UPI0039995626
MTGLSPFSYALVRVVPRIERGECVNVGVLLFCKSRDFLALGVRIDDARLAAFAPGLDLGAVRAALAGWAGTCAGEGPAEGKSLGERFGWLTAPRSTIVQPGPTHLGLTGDPGAELARLVELLVG